MSERVADQLALVLHARPFRNTSLLLELFTRDHGRIGMVARGGRAGTGRSPRAALLQPFQSLRLSWRRSGDLATLVSVEPAGDDASLRGLGSGDSLWCGLYLNELLLRLTHRGDPHPDLFADYLIALQQLGSGGDHEETLRRFELRLLAQIGYGMPLGADCHGEAISEERCYRLDAVEGFIPVTVGDDDSAWQGAMLLALSADAPLPAEHRRAARRLLRQQIERHLTKPMQTGSILRSLRDY